MISVGAGNDYGHPHEAAMRYYNGGGRRVLRTDLGGDIVVRVESDGTYEVEQTHELTAVDAATVGRPTDKRPEMPARPPLQPALPPAPPSLAPAPPPRSSP